MFPARVAAIALLSVAVSMAAILVARPPGSPDRGAAQLVVHCAAVFRKPLSEIARKYQDLTGTTIVPVFGPSETILANATLGGGDIMIPADGDYTDLARRRGLINRSAPVARITPVIAVAEHNPLAVRSFDDFDRPEVRFAIANRGAAIGKLTHQVLPPEQAHRARTLEPTVTALATALALGAVDAAIIWDVVAGQHTSLEAVHTPPLDAASVTATAAVLKTSAQPQEAARFLEYISSPQTGFTAFGYPAP